MIIFAFRETSWWHCAVVCPTLEAIKQNGVRNPSRSLTGTHTCSALSLKPPHLCFAVSWLQIQPQSSKHRWRSWGPSRQSRGRWGVWRSCHSLRWRSVALCFTQLTTCKGLLRRSFTWALIPTASEALLPPQTASRETGEARPSLLGPRPQKARAWPGHPKQPQSPGFQATRVLHSKGALSKTWAETATICRNPVPLFQQKQACESWLSPLLLAHKAWWVWHLQGRGSAQSLEEIEEGVCYGVACPVLRARRARAESPSPAREEAASFKAHHQEGPSETGSPADNVRSGKADFIHLGFVNFIPVKKWIR